MQVAIDTKTNRQVQIIEVNGGWTTVQSLTGSIPYKVRNGQLTKHTHLTDTTAKVAQEKVTTDRAQRALKPIDERKNGVVYAGYLPQYQAYVQELDDGTTRRSVDKGDTVALQLRVLALDDIYQIVSLEAAVSTRDLIAKYKHLNPGMQRMNLGNMLRRVRREAAKGAK